MIVKIKCTIIGSGIDYRKRVSDIPEKMRQLMKDFSGTINSPIFYTKTERRHYTQSGYKVVTYNPERYEFYHREPTPAQLAKIKKGEKIKK